MVRASYRLVLVVGARRGHARRGPLCNGVCMPLNRQSSLDGIRGTAALIVLLSHTSLAGQTLAPWLNFGGTGHVGVYLFFVLSAYLVTLSFIRGGCLIAPYAIR